MSSSMSAPVPATTLSPQDLTAISNILDSILDDLFEAFEARVQAKADATGVKIKVSFAQQATVYAVKLGVDVAKNYRPEEKLRKLVGASNKVLPHLNHFLKDDVLFKHLSPEIRTPETAALCDKVGATELGNLIRRAIAAAPVVAAPAAAVAAASTPVTETPPAEETHERWTELKPTDVQARVPAASPAPAPKRIPPMPAKPSMPAPAPV